MKILKRITTTIGSSFDSFVSRVEDHDALVKQALKDARAASARARVHLKRVTTDNENLRAQLQQLDIEKLQWIQRAVNSVDDEDLALGCIKRKRQCEKKITQLNDALEQQTSMRESIQRNIIQLDERVETINRQRNTMRSRQSTAEVSRIISELDDRSTLQVDEAFENWEMQISQDEFRYTTPIESDDFEASFIKSEEVATLREDLAKLRSSNGAENG